MGNIQELKQPPMLAAASHAMRLAPHCPIEVGPKHVLVGKKISLTNILYHNTFIEAVDDHIGLRN